MNKINVALCSYGMSGLVFHGPLLESHPGFKITKILERHRNDSEGKHPGSLIVREFDRILDDDKVELVIVNTPDHLHYEMALKVLEAGKHVVIEKPFTLSIVHANDLIRKAKDQNLIISVFQNRRWDGDFLTAREIIQSGKLGRLVDFESHFDRYRNYIQDSWKDQSTGTGTLWNLGSHLIDQALQLFGLPERIFCDSRQLREMAKTDDSYDLFLHYPHFKCQLRSSYLVREPGPRFILHGTMGSYLKWGIDPQEEELKEGNMPDSDGWGREPESAWGRMNTEYKGERLLGPYPTLPGDYMAFYSNIYEAMRNKAPLMVTGEQARDVVRVIEAAYQSSKEGAVIRL